MPCEPVFRLKFQNTGRRAPLTVAQTLLAFTNPIAAHANRGYYAQKSEDQRFSSLLRYEIRRVSPEIIREPTPISYPPSLFVLPTMAFVVRSRWGWAIARCRPGGFVGRSPVRSSGKALFKS